MTAPLDLLATVVVAASIVLAARNQLRLSPQPWYATRYFAAFASFEAMLVLPAAAYRYFFHADWAHMYLFEASRYTAAVAPASLLVVGAAGAATFGLGVVCSRTGRLWVLLVVLATAVAGIAAVVALGWHRLGLVGSYAQFAGTFGLRPLGETELLLAVSIMGACQLVAWVYILFQLIREGARWPASHDR